jgi:5-methylcytosine-specific restriction enzyme A
VVAATVADHIVPHRGDERLHWDESNIQGLCAHCHSSTTQQSEKIGFSKEVGIDGTYLDPGASRSAARLSQD